MSNAVATLASIERPTPEVRQTIDLLGEALVILSRKLVSEEERRSPMVRP
jgi:hypothetical protein